MHPSYLLMVLTIATSVSLADETTLFSLRDFSQTEMKSAGFELTGPTRVHLRALGGGGDYGWTYKSDRMYAYAWILDAANRTPVWQMTTRNTEKAKDDREFDDTITLQAGAYEVYFTAYAFTYHSWFSHFSTNVDHRQKPLFGVPPKKQHDFLSWFSGWWSEDFEKAWTKRAPYWGIDILVDEGDKDGISTFTPPKRGDAVVLTAVGLGDNQMIEEGFSLSAPTTIRVQALGEGRPGAECLDCGWIVNAHTRERVWDMSKTKIVPAGGAAKNVLATGTISLDKGTYVVYFNTDDSHSAQDWNDTPPFDPLSWGITLFIDDEIDRKNFAKVPYKDFQNIIVDITKVGDNESRSEGFTLKKEISVRIYALGERSNNRRSMADYATVIDARTRERVWTMEADRTFHAGGASKNRGVDEVITLPPGSYLVNYTTDDSHAYNEWNSAPPFDAEHYGITIMGTDESFSPSTVTKYVQQKDPSIIAQIVRVGNDVDRSEKFSLDRTTRVRVYAIGEGQNRDMYDYGWIEDALSGSVVWETTYSMTMHAGGGRKNRMVNTIIVLDKGNYRLRFKSDDSHSFNDWNTEPPDDSQFWGITLSRDTGEPPYPPQPPQLPPPRNFKP